MGAVFQPRCRRRRWGGTRRPRSATEGSARSSCGLPQPAVRACAGTYRSSKTRGPTSALRPHLAIQRAKQKTAHSSEPVTERSTCYEPSRTGIGRLAATTHSVTASRENTCPPGGLRVLCPSVHQSRPARRATMNDGPSSLSPSGLACSACSPSRTVSRPPSPSAGGRPPGRLARRMGVDRLRSHLRRLPSRLRCQWSVAHPRANSFLGDQHYPNPLLNHWISVPSVPIIISLSVPIARSSSLARSGPGCFSPNEECERSNRPRLSLLSAVVQLAPRTLEPLGAQPDERPWPALLLPLLILRIVAARGRCAFCAGLVPGVTLANRG
jgi:hypothetical protein